MSKVEINKTKCLILAELPCTCFFSFSILFNNSDDCINNGLLVIKSTLKLSTITITSEFIYYENQSEWDHSWWKHNKNGFLVINVRCSYKQQHQPGHQTYMQLKEEQEDENNTKAQTSSLNMDDKKFIITWCFLGNFKHSDLTKRRLFNNYFKILFTIILHIILPWKLFSVNGI